MSLPPPPDRVSEPLLPMVMVCVSVRPADTPPWRICARFSVSAAPPVMLIDDALMIWVPTYSMEAMFALLGGYAISQAFLTAMTLLRIRVFAKVNCGDCLQTQLKQGNIAMALKFAGQKIGAALAMSTAAQIVVYEEYSVGPILLAWLVASVTVSYTHLRAHETVLDLVCRLLLEKKNK